VPWKLIALCGISHHYKRKILRLIMHSDNTFRKIFERIERNHYLPATPGHGFNGYLETIANDGTVYTANPGVVDVLKSMVSSVGDNPADVIKMVSRDPNGVDAARDKTQGLFALPFHASPKYRRFSARDLVLSALNATNPDGTKKHPLTLKVHSLATRVLFDKRAGKKPRATGVEYLEGQSAYRGDPRYDSTKSPALRRAVARKEVIVSGGVFNSPQLLQLSGIGSKEELAKLDIESVVDLPGVGRNLQDNQEMPIVGHAQQPFVSTPVPGDPACTFGAPGDPCINAWLRGEGPYSRAGANTNAFMLKTGHSADGERDILLFSGPFAFRGFWPIEAVVNIPLDPPTTFAMSMVKIHPQNKAGYVKLRSANPIDTPEINFQLFKEGSQVDLGAMSDAVSWARKIYANASGPTGPVTPVEPPCPAGSTSCTNWDQQWIKDQAFGHHATSTCAIGSDRDKSAVLDSKFRVRGVVGLRVVDASAFPRTPGAFPVVSTFLLSEKATDDILDAAKKNEIDV
jgi:choline dehydrogenase